MGMDANPKVQLSMIRKTVCPKEKVLSKNRKGLFNNWQIPLVPLPNSSTAPLSFFFFFFFSHVPFTHHHRLWKSFHVHPITYISKTNIIFIINSLFVYVCFSLYHFCSLYGCDQCGCGSNSLTVRYFRYSLYFCACVDET